MTEKKDTVLFFILIYGFWYMGNAIYGSFIPVYLYDIGFTKTSVGLLMSLPPLVALAGQPFWGVISDNAKYKNNVFSLLICANIIVILLFPVSKTFLYLSPSSTAF